MKVLIFSKKIRSVFWSSSFTNVYACHVSCISGGEVTYHEYISRKKFYYRKEIIMKIYTKAR